MKRISKSVLFSKEHTIIIFSMIIRIVFAIMLRGAKMRYDGYINVLMLTRILYQ